MEGNIVNKNYIKTLKDALINRTDALGLVYNLEEKSDTECIINYNNKHTKLVFGEYYAFSLHVEVTENNEVRVHRSSVFSNKKTTSVMKMVNATKYIINVVLGAFDDCTYQLTQNDVVKGAVIRLKNRIKEVMKLDVNFHLLSIYDTKYDSTFFIHLKDMNKYLDLYEVKISDIDLDYNAQLTINEVLMYCDKDDNILETLDIDSIDYDKYRMFTSKLQLSLPKPYEFKNKKEYQIECEHLFNVIDKWINSLKLMNFLIPNK